jgi:hypothetical protein
MNLEMMQMEVWCPPAEHVPTTSTTVVDSPSPTPTTTNKDEEKLQLRGR